MALNPLSKYLLSALAERRGLAVVSVEGRTVIVKRGASCPAAMNTETAIRVLSWEINQGNPDEITVKLHEPGYRK